MLVHNAESECRVILTHSEERKDYRRLLQQASYGLKHINMEVSLPKIDCPETVANITRERKTCANWCERARSIEEQSTVMRMRRYRRMRMAIHWTLYFARSHMSFSLAPYWRQFQAVMPDRGRVPSRISPTLRTLRRSCVSVSWTPKHRGHGHAAPA